MRDISEEGKVIISIVRGKFYPQVLYTTVNSHIIIIMRYNTDNNIPCGLIYYKTFVNVL